MKSKQDQLLTDGAFNKPKIDVVIELDNEVTITCYCNGALLLKSPFDFALTKKPDVKKDGKMMAAWRNQQKIRAKRLLAKSFKETIYDMVDVSIKGIG